MAMQQTDKTLRGVALMLTFCVIAPLIDVASKLAAAEVTVEALPVLAMPLFLATGCCRQRAGQPCPYSRPAHGPGGRRRGGLGVSFGRRGMVWHMA